MTHKALWEQGIDNILSGLEITGKLNKNGKFQLLLKKGQN